MEIKTMFCKNKECTDDFAFITVPPIEEGKWKCLGCESIQDYDELIKPKEP
jgi:hypothetical protein